MKDYKIILIKKYGDRPDVKPDKGRQNLVMTLRVSSFESRIDLSEYSDRRLERVLKDRLKQVERNDINSKYPVEREEEVMLVEDYDLSDPLFRGELVIPSHLRRDEDEVKPRVG